MVVSCGDSPQLNSKHPGTGVVIGVLLKIRRYYIITYNRLYILSVCNKHLGFRYNACWFIAGIGCGMVSFLIRVDRYILLVISGGAISVIASTHHCAVSKTTKLQEPSFEVAFPIRLLYV